MKIDPNAPAFAAATCGDWQSGISIRAHFASLAMQGLAGQMLNDPNALRALKDGTMTNEMAVAGLARMSCLRADALIAELNK